VSELWTQSRSKLPSPCTPIARLCQQHLFWPRPVSSASSPFVLAPPHPCPPFPAGFRFVTASLHLPRLPHINK
jgi:hypothetical protein